MWVKSLSLKDVKSFTSIEELEFSKSINVFIGENNSGKSTILSSIYFLQSERLTTNDIRIGADVGKIKISIEGDDIKKIMSNKGPLDFSGNSQDSYFKVINVDISKGSGITKYLTTGNSNAADFVPFQMVETRNVIYPFLSKRKVTEYSENVDTGSVTAITGNFSNLYGKIDRVSNSAFQPANTEYKEACENILGFYVASSNSEKGKVASFIIHNQEHIPINSMGEGTINMLGLIVDLCLAEDQIFLIEELENDIHPRALKHLLELIIKKSNKNQFFISTHSNIIVKGLGSSQNCKLFNFKVNFRSESSKVPVSHITEIKNEPEERRKILEDLGYEFSDYELHNGWLFFEESSAEKIIRDYFLQWYFPDSKIIKFRTFSARSSSEVVSRFRNFNDLFVYLHLTNIYKNRAWVIIDGGEEESKVVTELRRIYSEHGWRNDNFLQFSRHDFEEYYPKRFQGKVGVALNSSQKMKEKISLLKEVLTWIEENKETAKTEFAESAKEVIELLNFVEASIS